MRKTKILSLLTSFILILCSCGSDESVQEKIELSQSELECTAVAGTLSVTVTSNTSWSVSVQNAPDWIAVSPASGSGDAVITINVKENAGSARTAQVLVVSKATFAKCVVTQAAASKDEGGDDDNQDDTKVTPISDVRAKYKGSDVKITEDITIQGVVISDYRKNTAGGLNNYTSAKAIVLSDTSAGIMLYCAADNTSFARGDKVEVSLKNQLLSVYDNGVLQVNGIPLANIKKVGTETPVAKEITAAELVTGKYEGMYVAVKDVQVTDEDKGKTFATAENHTSIGFEAKTGEIFYIFSSKYSTFLNEVVPSGSGVLKGIAGVNKNKYQISISAKSDYAALTGTRFSTGPKFSINGVSEISTTVSGDAGSYKLTLAAKEIEWTASSNNQNFVLSKTSGSNATEEITISYTNNPSTTDKRTAVITFKTTSTAVANQTLTLTINQSPFEALVSDAVNKWLELPQITEKEDFAYIYHTTSLNNNTVRNYSYWLDGKNRVANWVAYPLYRGIDANNTTRSDAWAFDPKVPKRNQPVLAKGWGVSGYDRGHQLPSADRLHSVEANKTTFYYTNMTAQNSSLNQGIWGKLETSVRNWADDCDTLYVVTGAVTVTKDNTTIEYIKDNSGNNVAIPKAYFKVLLRYKKANEATNGGYSAIGFWFENRAYSAASVTATDAKSVKKIEELTGLNFFHNLDDVIEAAVEEKFTASEWGL